MNNYIRYIWENVTKKIKKTIYLYIFLSVFLSMISIILPYLSGKYIDVLIKSTSYKNIMFIVITIILLNLINILLGYITSIFSFKINSELTFNITNRVIVHIQKIPISNIINDDPAYLTQRINEDANVISSFFTSNISNFIIKWAVLCVSMYFLIMINSIFFIFTLIFLFFQIVIFFSTKKIIYKKNLFIKEEQSKYFRDLNNQLLLIKELKIDSNFDKFNTILKKSYESLFLKFLDYSKFMTVISCLQDSLTSIFYILLLITGTYYFFNNKITVGEITIIFSYFKTSMDVILYYLNFNKSFQTIKVSMDRIFEFEKIKEEANGNTILNSINHITIKNLNYSYLKDKNLLRNINVSFEKNNIYLILGKNGSGKSTFLNLLLGIILNNIDGDILYNDNKISDIDLYTLRKDKISVMIQDTRRLNMSIKDILENVYEPITEIFLREFILNNDLETLYFTKKFDIIKNLNTNIFNLSGGELKKVYLLKTLLKNADIYIFDEPTVALDIDSIKHFKKIIYNLKYNEKIVIVVTHDNNLITDDMKVIELI